MELAALLAKAASMPLATRSRTPLPGSAEVRGHLLHPLNMRERPAQPTLWWFSQRTVPEVVDGPATRGLRERCRSW